MSDMEDISSVWIDGDIETVWDAITEEKKISRWYVPGSLCEIPNLKIGEKATFTLMPSVHNNLSEKLTMPLTIVVLRTYKEFSLYLNSQQTLLSFVIEKEDNGARVTMNSGGFDESLANLKALIEGNEIPFI
ncbi:SRPBCC domain-containing protein [Bacillus sp. FJAT-22090]|uniref:SRPBCC domain-containing protein n=1 Tax=Bacillus sp. FJAT-22090 TaxID=1581038 RepID=UPI000B2D6B0E|nr:SRPBCC domain-containing protein [Bacillus sp. FJAT-22090]